MSDYEFPPDYPLREEDDHDLYIDLMAQAQDEAMKKVKEQIDARDRDVEYDGWVRQEALDRAHRNLAGLRR